MVLAVLVFSWLSFCIGSLMLIHKQGNQDDITAMFLVLSPAIALVVALILYLTRKKYWEDPLRNQLEEHTKFIDSVPKSSVGVWIAIAAGASLYAELMMIRLHSSYFHLFAFFKNVSLISCFLGLGIGYARGKKTPIKALFIMPLLVLQIGILLYLRCFENTFEILKNPILENVHMGPLMISEKAHTRFAQVLAVYGFMVFIFTLNALCFIPFGQLVSRLMMRREKLVAYSWNLLGSIAGIIVFSLLAFIWAPPWVWLAILGAFMLLFFRKKSFNIRLQASLVCALCFFLAFYHRFSQEDIFSPYQMISVITGKDSHPTIISNNIYFQRMLDLRDKVVSKDTDLLKEAHLHYSMPYVFKKRPKDVLVVGAGTGNDVASAIRHGAENIDAVEIDPTILFLGKKYHPEKPYKSERVNPVIQDARAYIRETDKKYDLIVYGMLDSHTLLANKSGVRLDSYIYTVEALRDMQALLKKNGVLCLTFTYMHLKLQLKLFESLKQASGGIEPHVYRSFYDNSYSFIVGESQIHRKALERLARLEVTDQIKGLLKMDRFKGGIDVSTDDWPFFYMPKRQYPFSYMVMILLLLGASGVLIHRFMYSPKAGFSFPCFFLGAGFLLVETKGIAELALVYGSMWLVVSIAIIAILIMAFLANLMVWKSKSLKIGYAYALLCASLAAGYFLPVARFSMLPLWALRLVVPVVLFLPIFFAGIVFSSELKRSWSVAVALSSNLFGAMLGGFLEYNSMFLGIRALYIIAVIIYVFAWLTHKKAYL